MTVVVDDAGCEIMSSRLSGCCGFVGCRGSARGRCRKLGVTMRLMRSLCAAAPSRRSGILSVRSAISSVRRAGLEPLIRLHVRAA